MSPLLSLSFYGNKDLWQLIELSDHKFDRGILSLSYPFTATEDVKSAMGPYCRRYKCTVFFSFLVCPLSLIEKPWIILSQQKTRDGPESAPAANYFAQQLDTKQVPVCFPFHVSEWCMD
jgi:hypothetical protein